MNLPDENASAPALSQRALSAKRDALRRQLQCRRQQIVLALQAGGGGRSAFPRSHTMRFLTHNPLLAAGLVAVLLRTIFRIKLARTVPSLLVLAKYLHAASRPQRISDTAHRSESSLQDVER